jgi:hypothetical protein
MVTFLFSWYIYNYPNSTNSIVQNIGGPSLFRETKFNCTFWLVDKSNYQKIARLKSKQICPNGGSYKLLKRRPLNKTSSKPAYSKQQLGLSLHFTLINYSQYYHFPSFQSSYVLRIWTSTLLVCFVCSYFGVPPSNEAGGI